jgi:hypothetical protein
VFAAVSAWTTVIPNVTSSRPTVLIDEDSSSVDPVRTGGEGDASSVSEVVVVVVPAESTVHSVGIVVVVVVVVVVIVVVDDVELGELVVVVVTSAAVSPSSSLRVKTNRATATNAMKVRSAAKIGRRFVPRMPRRGSPQICSAIPQI